MNNCAIKFRAVSDIDVTSDVLSTEQYIDQHNKHTVTSVTLILP